MANEDVTKVSGKFYGGVAVALLCAPIAVLFFGSEVAGWCVALSPLLFCAIAWIKKRDDGVWLGLSTAMALLPYALLAVRVSLPPHSGGP